MNARSPSHRVLDPLERFSEIVFGLIMVLSFTCAISVAEIGRQDVHAMLIGAIGCNLAWGIIDAAFYLIACLAEHGRYRLLLRDLHQSTEPEHARQIVADALPTKLAEVLPAADLDQLRARLAKLSPPLTRARLTAENWRGAIGVFLLVFLSTFPVVVPFIFIRNAHFALRLSNGVAIALLFAAGHMLASYAGLRRLPTSLSIVAIGIVLVALTIALGG